MSSELLNRSSGRPAHRQVRTRTSVAGRATARERATFDANPQTRCPTTSSALYRVEQPGRFRTICQTKLSERVLDPILKILRRCVEKPVDRRWASFTELRAELNRAWTDLTTAAHPRRVNGLMVLPLRNLSGDPTQDFFADGMAETLTWELAGRPSGLPRPSLSGPPTGRRARDHRTCRHRPAWRSIRSPVICSSPTCAAAAFYSCRCHDEPGVT
jgi:hypothetical protein